MKRWWLAALVLAVPILGFAYYAISPLFITLEGNDAAPLSTGTGAEVAANIVDTPAHPASGKVRIIGSEGKTFVRYEDYQTINGPDIYVYLSKDLDAKEFVSLGRVKTTVGSANYEVPAGVDVSEYRYVLTWCKMFGVLFNYADVRGTDT